MENELTTVLDWVRYASSQFNQAHRARHLEFGHGTANAIDEAAWLVMAALALDPDRYESFAAARVTSSEALKLNSLIRARLETRQPLAYLLGEAWLMGHRFLSDSRALVPRSLIAELLDQALDPFLLAEPARILDLCTGGASLAILAGYRYPGAEIVGSDISVQALELAKANRDLHGMTQRLELVQSDLFNKIKGKFDLIISNPPYVNADSMTSLPAEFLAEPQIALHGGKQGMDLIEPILQNAKRFLTKNGLLVVELGHEAPYFEAKFPSLPVTWLATANSDQAVFVVPRADL